VSARLLADRVGCSPSGSFLRPGLWGLFSAGVVVFLTACDRRPGGAPPSQPPTAERAGDVVAWVGEAVITREAFRGELSRRGHVQGKTGVLEGMIRHEALLAKARAAGYDRDPELRAAFGRMIAARYQEDRLDRSLSQAAPVSAAEIARAYERDLSRYRTPAMARGAVILHKVSPKATAERQAQVKQLAETVLAQARQGDAAAYVALVQRHSEDQATRYKGGDTGWLSRTEAQSRWDPAVLEALFALSRPGEFAPLISTPSGIYIVRLSDLKPPGVRSLEEVQEDIRHQLARERQLQLRREFFEGLKHGLKIEINQAALEAIPEPTNRAALSAPAQPAG